MTKEELREQSRQQQLEHERVIRNQRPMTFEQFYTQVQRSTGLWSEASDMTAEEVQAHQKKMKPIWGRMTVTPPPQPRL